MLILVYGEDGYRSHQTVQQLVTHFRTKYDPDGHQTRSFGPNDSIDDAIAAIRNQGLFSKEQCLVLRGLGAKVTEELLQSARNLDATQVVIVHEPQSEKALKKLKVFNAFLEAEGVPTYSHPAMSSHESAKWVQRLAKEHGSSLSPALASKLVERVGTDTWQLANTIKSLSSFTDAIDDEAVLQFSQPSAMDQLFPLIDALVAGQSAKSVQLLTQQQRFGTSIEQILAMLENHVGKLLQAHSFFVHEGTNSDQFSKEANHHPFVAKKLLQQARSFTSEQLSALHAALLTYNHERKQSRRSSDETVASLLTLLASTSQEGR